jgi:hypothetical protein
MIPVADWNSLEIAKLAVGALTPIFLFILGYMVTNAARRVEQAQWANRKLIESRLELYERMADAERPLLLLPDRRPLRRGDAARGAQPQA